MAFGGAQAQGLGVAVPRTSLSLPIYVAQEQGFFAAEGVDVRLIDCSGGHRCLRMLLDGQADVATAGELPILLNSFERADYAVIGTIVTAANDVRLVANARSGITTPAHLAGKRIGTVIGASSQYFLDVYLLTVGVDPRTLSIVGLQPEEILPALQSGSVDAVAIWDPIAYDAVRTLGGVLLPHTSAYLATFNLVVQRRLAGAHDATLVRLLRAVERAERFIQERPADAKAILRTRLKFDQGFIDWNWPALSYRLGLDQALITMMEGEARWAIREGHVKSRTPPNVLGLLHTAPLKRVNPAAVGIDR